MHQEVERGEAVIPSTTGIGVGLTIDGFAVSAAGLLVALTSLYVAATTSVQSNTVRPLILPQLIVGAFFIHHGQRLRLEGRRHFVKAAKMPEQGEQFVAYFRSFREDRRQANLEPQPMAHPWAGLSLFAVLIVAGRSEEEQLMTDLAGLGPVIAVGDPDEGLAPAGARRFYLPRGDWKEPVRELMRRARLVVISLGNSPGVIWEYVEAMQLVPVERLLLLVPMNERGYDEFRSQAAAALRARRAEVGDPHSVSLRRAELPDYKPAGPFSFNEIQGVVTFPDGEPTYTPIVSFPFYNSIRISLRPQIKKLTRPLLCCEGSGEAPGTISAKRPMLVGLLLQAAGLAAISVCAFATARLCMSLGPLIDDDWVAHVPAFTDFAFAAMLLAGFDGGRALGRYGRRLRTRAGWS